MALIAMSDQQGMPISLMPRSGQPLSFIPIADSIVEAEQFEGETLLLFQAMVEPFSHTSHPAWSWQLAAAHSVARALPG